MGPFEGLLFNLLLAAGLLLLVRDQSTKQLWPRQCAIALMLALTFVYVMWRLDVTLPSFAWTPRSVWPWLFFGCEAAQIGYEVWSWIVLLQQSNHSPTADVYERRLRRETALPSVDVFIPTYSEGPEILEATIRGALALDYSGSVRIWVLDDKRRPWLKELCATMAAGYLARPTHEHGKAGNLNYALPRTHGAFIVVIDADFVLEKQFLFRTMGFLLYERGIGLVQTPQNFHNPDPVQHNLFGSKAWTEEQNFFMTVVQPARDAYENAFCVGSGWVIRRELLEELGGFPQQSICEDLEISYVLKARGHRTLFLNEQLAWGLAPESVPEYIKQRIRWCCGTLQHLFLDTGPLRARGLSWRDRLFYFEPIVFWLTYPFVLLVFVAPVIFWFTGIPAMENASDGFLVFMLPRLIVIHVAMCWLSDGKVMPIVSTIQKMLPVFYQAAEVSKFFFAPFGRPFNVTTKGHQRDQIVVQWSILRMFLILFVLLSVGILMNLTGYHEIVKSTELTVFDVSWTVYTLLVLLLCMLACVELPRGSLCDSTRTAQGDALRAMRALLFRLFS
jgi:cellulose synthase (UDP-forming)